MKDGVTSLESLAAMNIELEPKRRGRSPVRLLDIVRGLSSSLYRAVCSSLMCACKHRISMRVSDYRGDITPDHDDEDIIQGLKLHLALSIPRAQFDKSLSAVIDKQWKELLIRSNLPLQVSVQTPNLLQDTTNPIISPTKQKRTVKFSLSRFSSSTTTTIVQTETSLVSDSTSSMSLEATGVDLAKPNTQSNIDLCDKLKTSSAAEGLNCFGIISDKSHANTRSYSVSLSTSSSGNGWEMVSLKESLESRNGKMPLTYKKRLQLSVFIARSVLEFYKTPWLPEMPSSRDIFFIQSESSPDYDRPFFMAKNERSEAKSKTTNDTTIRNPTLLAIGVLLIELLRGQTIESLQTPEEILVDGPLSLYMTASRLLRGVFQASSNYGTAVSRCIDGKIQGKDLNLENENDRHNIYHGVIALLEEDLKNS